MNKPNSPPDPPIEQILVPTGPTTEYITIPQGLPDFKKIATNNVNCIHIDSEDNLYLCTDGGLSISTDSGATFSTKTTSNGLKEHRINDIITDSNGVIYAATFNSGIAYSTDNGDTFTTITASDGLVSNNVISLFEKGGKVYAGTSYGLSIINNFGETITSYTTSNTNLPNNTITDVYLDLNNILYVTTSSGLSISVDDGASYTTVGAAEGITNFSIKKNYRNSSGKIILATTDHLFITQNNHATKDSNGDLVLDPNGFTQQNVLNNSTKSVVEDSSGNLYVSTSFGVTKLTNNNGTYSSAIKITGNLYRDIGMDSNGKIYVASNVGLYSSIDQGANYNLTTSDGLFKNVISGIDLDSQNNLYVATDGGGLGLSNDGGNTFTKKDNMASNRIFTVVVDKTNDKIYVGTASGISISDDYGETFLNKTTADGLSNNRVKCLTFKNGVLYAGLNDSTNSFAYSTDGGETFTSQSSNGFYIYKIYIDDDGAIYAASNGGLLIAQDYNSPFTLITQTDGLSSNSLYSVTKGPDGKFYLGSGTRNRIDIMTDNGELENPRYTFERIDSTSGLLSNYPKDIYFNSNGDMYVSSSDGLSITNDGGLSFVNKSISDGLSDTYLQGIKVDSNQKMYIATMRGISILNDL